MAVNVVRNDYVPETLANVAKAAAGFMRRFEGVKGMICGLSWHDVFDIDGDMAFKVNVMDSGEFVRMPLEQVCAIFLMDDAQLANLTRTWFEFEGPFTNRI